MLAFASCRFGSESFTKPTASQWQHTPPAPLETRFRTLPRPIKGHLFGEIHRAAGPVHQPPSTPHPPPHASLAPAWPRARAAASLARARSGEKNQIQIWIWPFAPSHLGFSVSHDHPSSFVFITNKPLSFANEP